MTTTIEVTLQNDLLDFLDQYAKKLNRRREEIIADAIKLSHAVWEMEKGYLEDKEENLAFAESAMPLFAKEAAPQDESWESLRHELLQKGVANNFQ